MRVTSALAERAVIVVTAPAATAASRNDLRNLSTNVAVANFAFTAFLVVCERLGSASLRANERLPFGPAGYSIPLEITRGRGRWPAHGTGHRRVALVGD